MQKICIFQMNALIDLTTREVRPILNLEIKFY